MQICTSEIQTICDYCAPIYMLLLSREPAPGWLKGSSVCAFVSSWCSSQVQAFPQLLLTQDELFTILARGGAPPRGFLCMGSFYQPGSYCLKTALEYKPFLPYRPTLYHRCHTCIHLPTCSCFLYHSSVCPLIASCIFNSILASASQRPQTHTESGAQQEQKKSQLN